MKMQNQKLSNTTCIFFPVFNDSVSAQYDQNISKGMTTTKLPLQEGHRIKDRISSQES